MLAPIGPDVPFAQPDRAQRIKWHSEGIAALPPTSRKVTFRTAWACLWLADIQQLQGMLSYLPVKIEDFLSRLEQVEARNIVAKQTQADRDPHSKTPWAASTLSQGYRDERGSRPVPFQSFNLTSYNVVVPPREVPASLGSLARKRPAEDIESGKNKRAKIGSVPADKECHERDGGCFLTKTNPAVSKVVHLYPPSMKNPNTAGVVMFWRMLRMFWSEDRVNAWWQAIYGDEAGAEKPQNQICMSPSAHEMYTQGLFALEPLPLDKNSEGRELSVRFWWLKLAESTGRVDLITQPQLPSDFDPSGYGLGLHNVRTGEPIRSGDVITLRTHNPETHPLPDIRILEMQWFLNRVTALRDAAEPRELPGDESESDSDDGLPWLVSSIIPEESSPPVSFSSESSKESSSTEKEPIVTLGEAKKDSE